MQKYKCATQEKFNRISVAGYIIAFISEIFLNSFDLRSKKTPPVSGGEQLKTEAIRRFIEKTDNYLIGFFAVQKCVDSTDACTVVSVWFYCVVAIEIFNRSSVVE